jgi:energy-coupling factor transporter ATP-binding protein EcfA2
MIKNLYRDKYLKYKYKYIKQNGGVIEEYDSAKPIFLIVLGPTGSGKTKLVSHVIDYLNEKYRDTKDIITFKKILIDDIIENNKIYKCIVNLIIRKLIEKDELDLNTILEINEHIKNIKQDKNLRYYMDNYNLNIDMDLFTINQDKIIKILNHPSQILIDLFNSAYFLIRKYDFCRDDESKSIICDELNDKNLKESLSNSDNIIFETQGIYSIDWLFNIFFTSELQDKYNIIYAYSDVKYDKLKQRNKNRAGEQYLSYIKNMNLETTLRLPELKDNIFCDNTNIIKNNLIKLLEDTKNNRRILIFDNNEDMVIKFDNINEITKQYNYNFLFTDRCIVSNKKEINRCIIYNSHSV